MHLGQKALGRKWDNILRHFKNRVGGGDDPAERKVVDDLFASLEHLRFGLAAFRIDGGLGLNLVTVFSDKGPVRKFLDSLGEGQVPSTLLPPPPAHHPPPPPT